MPITLPMPRKKQGSNEEPKAKGGRSTAPVQIDAELRDWIALICEHKKLSASELLSPHLRPWLLPQYKEAAAAIAKKAAELE